MGLTTPRATNIKSLHGWIYIYVYLSCLTPTVPKVSVSIYRWIKKKIRKEKKMRQESHYGQIWQRTACRSELRVDMNFHEWPHPQRLSQYQTGIPLGTDISKQGSPLQSDTYIPSRGQEFCFVFLFLHDSSLWGREGHEPVVTLAFSILIILDR